MSFLFPNHRHYMTLTLPWEQLLSFCLIPFMIFQVQLLPLSFRIKASYSWNQSCKGMKICSSHLRKKQHLLVSAVYRFTLYTVSAVIPLWIFSLLQFIAHFDQLQYYHSNVSLCSCLLQVMVRKISAKALNAIWYTFPCSGKRAVMVHLLTQALHCPGVWLTILGANVCCNDGETVKLCCDPLTDAGHDPLILEALTSPSAL